MYDFYNFEAPYRQNGLWVEDVSRRNVCECPSQEIAKALAAHLNRKANKVRPDTKHEWATVKGITDD